jgi:hypothetical protein
MSVKNNTQAHFLVGCLVIFCGYKCWSLGLFDAWLFPTEDDSVESANLVAMAVSALVQAVTLVGYVAIGLVTGLGPLAESFTEKAKSMFSRNKRSQEIDGEALNSVLAALAERLNDLETKLAKAENEHEQD